MMMPKDYARGLMQSGQREKASAFMEYVFDFDEHVDNSLRFYASSWNVGKTTASRWIEEFKDKLAEHFDFWTIQNELKYRGTLAGQSRDSKRDTKKPIASSSQQSERDTKEDTFGTVAGQRVNTKNTNTSVSGKKQVFSPPTIKEIQAFINSENLNVSANNFFNHYESNGWMVGKNKMKSWTAALQKWNTSPFNNTSVTNKQTHGGLI